MYLVLTSDALLCHGYNVVIKKLGINLHYHSFQESDKELPTMWIFPYFMEPHIKAALPSMTMLDYKVQYLMNLILIPTKRNRQINVNCISSLGLIFILGKIYRWFEEAR